jgi:regulator of nonsense transcripts 1
MARSSKERREIQYCERCAVPTDYCRFFHHVDGPGDPDSAPTPAAATPGRPDVVITIKSRTKKKIRTTVAKLEDWEIAPKSFAKQIAKEHNVGCAAKQAQDSWSVEIQGNFHPALVGILTDDRHHVPKQKIQIRDKRKKQSDQVSNGAPLPVLRPFEPPQESKWAAEIENVTPKHRGRKLKRGAQDLPLGKLLPIENDYGDDIDTYIRTMRGFVFQEWHDAQEEKEKLAMTGVRLEFSPSAVKDYGGSATIVWWTSFVVPSRYVMDDEQEMLSDYSGSYLNLGDGIKVQWDNSRASMKGKVRQIVRSEIQTAFELPAGKRPPGYYDAVKGEEKVPEVLFQVTFTAGETIFRRRMLALDLLRSRGHRDLLRRVILGHVPPRTRQPTKLIPDAYYEVQTASGTKLTFEATPRQTEAVNRALSDAVTLIQGPPGCGKTAVVVAVAYHALRQKAGRLLICAPCNVACENIIRMLVPVMNAAGKKAVWLTGQKRDFRSYANLDDTQKAMVFWHALQRETLEGHEFRRLQEQSWRGHLPGEMQRRLGDLRNGLERNICHEADVVCCTLEGAAMFCLGELRFQMVILDEATQAV